MAVTALEWYFVRKFPWHLEATICYGDTASWTLTDAIFALHYISDTTLATPQQYTS